MPSESAPPAPLPPHSSEDADVTSAPSTPASKPEQEPTTEPASVIAWWQRLRYQGSRGGFIPLHRSMATIAIKRRDIAVSALLSIFFTGGWLLVLPLLLGWWTQVITFWVPLLGLETQVQYHRLSLGSSVRGLHYSMPAIELPASTPDQNLWLGSLIGVVLLFLVAQLLYKRFLPWAYLVRAVALIHTSALAYFLIAPGSFPYTLGQYLWGLLFANLILISLVPALLALTYYIFDFALWKKVALTLCIMGHLAVFAPLQFLIHAYSIHSLSLLFMPVFHLMFGIVLSVMIIVALYAWGMSWEERSQAT